LEQRRQISGMPGMWEIFWVVMPSGFRKICTGAAAALVDMQSEKSGFRRGKTANPDLDQHTISFLIEMCFTHQMRVFRAAVNMGNGIGTNETMMHNFTSGSAYACRIKM
jgi:hypothetical protein